MCNFNLLISRKLSNHNLFWLPLLVGNIACVYYLILHFIVFLRLIVGGPKPCSSNPCGANAVCQDTQNGAGYLCTCKEGYTGQPFRGCTGKH